MVTRPEILIKYTKNLVSCMANMVFVYFEVETESIYSVMANVSTSVIMNPVVQDISNNGL